MFDLDQNGAIIIIIRYFFTCVTKVPNDIYVFSKQGNVDINVFQTAIFVSKLLKHIGRSCLINHIWCLVEPKSPIV